MGRSPPSGLGMKDTGMKLSFMGHLPSVATISNTAARSPKASGGSSLRSTQFSKSKEMALLDLVRERAFRIVVPLNLGIGGGLLSSFSDPADYR